MTEGLQSVRARAGFLPALNMAKALPSIFAEVPAQLCVHSSGLLYIFRPSPSATYPWECRGIAAACLLQRAACRTSAQVHLRRQPPVSFAQGSKGVAGEGSRDGVHLGDRAGQGVDGGLRHEA